MAIAPKKCGVTEAAFGSAMSPSPRKSMEAHKRRQQATQSASTGQKPRRFQVEVPPSIDGAAQGCDLKGVSHTGRYRDRFCVPDSPLHRNPLRDLGRHKTETGLLQLLPIAEADMGLNSPPEGFLLTCTAGALCVGA